VINEDVATDPNFFDLKALKTDGSGNLVITIDGAKVPVVSALTLTVAPALAAE
jgi:hypothetical protein